MKLFKGEMMPEEMTKEEAWEKVIEHKEQVRAKKKEKGMNLWPIEDGLEDDIIDYIKGKKLTESELMDLEDRLEMFFYGCRLKCRKRTYFFRDGFEFYVNNLSVDLRKLQHIKESFPKFYKAEVTSEMDQGYSTLGIKLTL